MMKPNSMRHLDDAIRRMSGNTPESHIRTRTIMANAIVARMLPDGVIKGGSALKMRFGNEKSRFTTDLDIATAIDPELYANKLGQALKAGWEGFSGRVVPRDPASPEGVPAEYVMKPYDIKLDYLGKPWCTVPLEVGHNEIGDADSADWSDLSDAAILFEKLGFPLPGKAPLMPIEHQIAQKLHAVTTIGDRARDLVDLQLITQNCEIDFAKTKTTCVRLFSYRKAQTWPPIVTEQHGWADLYVEQSSGLPVLQDLDEAIAWANDFIAQIDTAE